MLVCTQHHKVQMCCHWGHSYSEPLQQSLDYYVLKDVSVKALISIFTPLTLSECGGDRRRPCSEPGIQ